MDLRIRHVAHLLSKLLSQFLLVSGRHIVHQPGTHPQCGVQWLPLMIEMVVKIHEGLPAGTVVRVMNCRTESMQIEEAVLEGAMIVTRTDIVIERVPETGDPEAGIGRMIMIGTRIEIETGGTNTIEDPEAGIGRGIMIGTGIKSGGTIMAEDPDIQTEKEAAEIERAVCTGKLGFVGAGAEAEALLLEMIAMITTVVEKIRQLWHLAI